MKRDGTARGLLSRVGSREIAEWHLDKFFEDVEKELDVLNWTGAKR
jgi:hypothetical protein